jgi:hypothetical protein
MGRATVIITNEAQRAKAMDYLRRAPLGTVVDYRRNKRSTPQNDRMWAMLTEIAQQTDWHGVKLEPEDWKLVFMEALNREMRLVPNLEGNGFVNLGRSSSKLTTDEHSELTALIEAFGAERGVQFSDPSPQSTGGNVQGARSADRDTQ